MSTVQELKKLGFVLWEESGYQGTDIGLVEIWERESHVVQIVGTTKNGFVIKSSRGFVAFPEYLTIKEMRLFLRRIEELERITGWCGNVVHS